MRCLFCKENSDDTKGIEHVIPESIGSKKLVLPRGMVCDKCNNYFSLKVEKPVLSHPSMRNVRGWYQVPNKKKKFPSVLGTIAGTEIEINMRAAKNGQIQIKAERQSQQPIVDDYLNRMEKGEEAGFIFQINIDPPQKEMSRFLAMMAFEALALRMYHAGMYEVLLDEPSYELIREFTRYGTGVKHWPYHRQVLFPMEALMRHPESNEWVQAGFGHDLILTTVPETYFAFYLYGVQFVINLGGPSIEGYEQWLKTNDPLERAGIKIVPKIENGTTKHYLEGSYSLLNGAQYDKQKMANNVT